MKNIIRVVLIILISVVLILILNPYLKSLEEQKNYDFTLKSYEKDIKKDDFKGKVLAIYFGYATCPDVCPTSLSSLAFALNSFDEEKSKNFVGVFVSVDPKRDSLENLKEYSSYFHKSFIGATSTKAVIDDMVKRYGSFYEIVELKNSSIDYSVAHTSYIYIFDKDGKFIEKIDHFSDPNKIKEVLQNLL